MYVRVGVWFWTDGSLTTQSTAPHSEEAQLARSGSITYGKAVERLYDRRNALSNAYPFSARIVGHGTDFLCLQGVLCILRGNSILIADLYSTSDTYEINLGSILGMFSRKRSEEPKLSLLYYSNGIITIQYERNDQRSGGRILVLDAKSDTPEDERMIRDIALESNHKLFARHTSTFLCYGTHTGNTADGGHEWELRCVSLRPEVKPSFSQPLQLVDFFGSDIGSTVAFEVHNDHFYALANQTSLETYESDRTSFYHCIRFPLARCDNATLEVNRRIYRRQHAEGPIHDSWTDLSIQLDERTNKAVIVESRREWRRGSSSQFRTFYTSEITFPRRCSLEFKNESPSHSALSSADNPMLFSDDESRSEERRVGKECPV